MGYFTTTNNEDFKTFYDPGNAIIEQHFATMCVNFNFCWGTFEWRSAAVSSDADCELNFLN